MNAYSKLTYQVDQKFSQFNSYIGVNDVACASNLIFEVYVDDKIKYQSPSMEKWEDVKFISIDIKNATQLSLVVRSSVDNSICTFGNWADAKLLVSPDSDGDGVCDDFDICPGADDLKDENEDGIPDDCETVKEGGIIEMNAFPNPFTEHVEVLLIRPNPLIQKAQLTVYDLYGRMVFQDSNVGYWQKYRMGRDWKPGIYFIHVKAGAFENKIKIVKGSF